MVPPASHGIPRVLRYSGSCSLYFVFAYVSLTLFGWLSHTIRLTPQMLYAVLYPASISTHGLASYAFARHYLRNLFWFLFLTLLRCFSSGGSLHTPIYSVYDTYLLGYVSFLIQTSAAQRIFAPPRSFSQLITSFFGSRCQGIRPALFLAWPFSLKSQSSFFLTFSWILHFPTEFSQNCRF